MTEITTHDDREARHPFDEDTYHVVVDYPFTRNGTTVTFNGVTTDGEHQVTFACDWRPAQDLIEALYNDEEAVANVAAWQCLSVTPVEHEAPFPEPVDWQCIAHALDKALDRLLHDGFTTDVNRAIESARRSFRTAEDAS